MRGRGSVASTASEASRIASSRIAVPQSISPTGSSPAAWHGRLRAQPSSRLTIEGLRSSRPLAAKKASSLATSGAIVGATIETFELPLLGEIASINASGGFAAAESWAWHRKLLAERGGAYDPRVAMRIRRGAAMSAADYIELVAAR